MQDNGITSTESRYSVAETMDRLASAATAAGLHIFIRIDHAAGAAEVGMELRPTQLLIFGNPKGGTPLMQDRQTAGLDLPAKALAWQDAHGSIWLSYNDADWIAQRHGLGEPSETSVAALRAGMAKLAATACVG